MANESSNFGTNGIVMAALAVSGALYFYHNPPLHGARPEIMEAQLHETSSEQKIEARLWQDPFAAVARDTKAKDPDWQELFAAMAKSAGKAKHADDPENCSPVKVSGATEVLGVMVPGGPYAELSEVRRRTRYAVLSALESRGYIGKSQDHIGCWAPDNSSIPREIPFEWVQGNNEKQSLLVLWLNEDILVEHPLKGISNVLDKLGTTGANTVKIVGPYTSDALESMIKEAPVPPNRLPPDDAQPPNLVSEVAPRRSSSSHQRASRKAGVTLTNHFLRNHALPSQVSEIVLGRSSSLQQRASKQNGAVLAQADPPLKETNQQTLDCPDPQKGGWERLKSVYFYSYGATIDETQLPEYPPDCQQSQRNPLERNLSTYFHDHGVNFRRWIATDRHLADSIAKELALRRVRPGATSDLEGKLVRDHVALISEWDTIYGRTIAPTMTQSFAAKNESTDPNCTTNESPEIYRPNQCPWAHEFKYLRGLDGALPRLDAVEDKESNNQAKEDADDVKAAMRDRAKARADEEAFDRPNGQGQQDYLLRLAKSLLEKDKELQAEGKGRITAIGVLGSDVFDKLLVLRALKPKFPRAVFFTTDFDYTLTMSSELNWTRNLLISSGFGPTLDGERQSQIPPFRGSYETSAFLATQLAIDGTEFKDPRPFLTPRIFEVERTGDVLQLPVNKISGARERAETPSGISPVQPKDEPIYPKPRGFKWLAVLLVILIAASLVYLLGPARRQSKENNKRYFLVQHIEVLSLCMVLLVAAYLSAFWEPVAEKLTSDGTGEPFVFLGGVSLWPSILLRILTIIISISLIVRGWRKLYDNLDQIATEIGLAQPKVVIRHKRALQMRNKLDWIDRILSCFSAAAAFHRCVRENGTREKYFDVRLGWVELVFHERYWARCLRMFVCTMIMLFAFIVFCELTEFPYAPSRGELAFNLYRNFTFLDILGMLVLVFTVADATFLFWLFVRELGTWPSRWPGKARTRYSKRINMRANDPHPAYWIDIDFIAKRTSCIGELIYYPFAVVALMIISRSTAFANFDLNWPIMITQGICLGILIICALTLRHAAERARDVAKKKIIDGAISEDSHQGKLGALLSRITDMQEGAFRPLTQQPLVRAVLLPLASIGLTALTEYGLIPL